MTTTSEPTTGSPPVRATSDVPELETLRVDLDDAGVVTVTLDRPGAMNTMNRTMRDELAACFDWLRTSDARVVVITGSGDAFCAGGDVNDFTGEDAEQLHDLMQSRSHRWFQALWSLPMPTIAMVNGTAAGGGANLVLATDIAIASERARFGETFVRIGLMPDLGGLFALPRAVGLRKAKELCFTGRLLDATEAAELGIVARVVPHDDLAVAVRELARDLAAKPHRTLAMTKAVLNRSFEASMEETMLYELLGQSFLFGTADHKEALSAFLEHRPPRPFGRRDGGTDSDTERGA